MGCTQSKIENEEMVARCNDRKLFMKEAVSARNAFAATHSAYSMSLKNTGAALCDYASAELHHPSSVSAASTTVPAVSQSPYGSLPPPPPPLPNYPSSQLQRAATLPEFSVPKPDHNLADTVIEEENEDEIENGSQSLRHRSNQSRNRKFSTEVEEELPQPPPSPPPPQTPSESGQSPPPPPVPDTKGMSWEFFFPSMPGPSLAEADLSRIGREESERQALEEMPRRSEVDGGGHGGGRRSGKAEAELPPQQPEGAMVMKKMKQGVLMESKRGGKVVANVHPVQIFNALDDCFLKASESAHEVSKMLEANRLHYHSNFADNRGITLRLVAQFDDDMLLEKLMD